MHITIEPHSHLPVHIQLRRQIEFLILDGELASGTKLPTTRQLAGFLRINRNTVLRAYQELAQAGLIECRQGRGCVVVEGSRDAVRFVSTALLAIIDKAIEQAENLGVQSDDLAAMLYARAEQRQGLQAGNRLAFVECELAIATVLAQTIQKRLGTQVVPVVLRDLEERAVEVERLLRQVNVVATTFFHVQEVRRLLAGRKVEVVGLGVKPYLQNLIQIAGIPQGTPAGLICVSEHCASEMKQSLQDAGIKGLKAFLYGTDNLGKFVEELPRLSVVIASDFVADKVQPLLSPSHELIVLDYTTLDEGAVSLLRSMLAEGPQTAQVLGSGQATAHPPEAW